MSQFKNVFCVYRTDLACSTRVPSFQSITLASRIVKKLDSHMLHSLLSEALTSFSP